MSRVARNLATPTEETRKERIFLGFLLPTPSPPRRRASLLVVIVEIFRIGPTVSAYPTATVAPLAMPPRLSLGIRDERKGLQVGTERRCGRPRPRRRGRGELRDCTVQGRIPTPALSLGANFLRVW